MGVAHLLFYYLLRELHGDRTPLWFMEVVVYHQVVPLEMAHVRKMAPN
jgi:hypothetical protein